MPGRPIAALLIVLTAASAAAEAQGIFVPGGPGVGAPAQGSPAMPMPPSVYGQGGGGTVSRASPSFLVGTWNGTTDDGSQLANHFEADGRFTIALQSANGFRTRMWGHYTVSADPGGKTRLDLRYEGWLPKRNCRQPPGQTRECTSVEFNEETDLLSFPALDTLSIDEASDGSPPIVLRRDGDTRVLNAPVPEQYVDTSPEVPESVPYTSPYRRRGYGTADCQNDRHQRALCRINDGHLVYDHYGCLRCISPD